jgi:hypothetical protein
VYRDCGEEDLSILRVGHGGRRMASSGMLRRVALVRTEGSEELSASFMRVTRIDELGTLAVISNRHTLRRNTFGC